MKQSISLRDLQGVIESEKHPDGKDKTKRKTNESQVLLDSKLIYDERYVRALDEKKRQKLQEKVEVAYAELTRLLDEYSKVRILSAEVATEKVEKP